MHIEFKIGLDKTDSLNYKDFLPEEVDSFLNNAIGKFTEQRAYGNNKRGLGFEETQKRLDDLRTLVKNTNITTFTNTPDNKPNGVFITLPTDYRHAVEEDATISFIDCKNQTQTKITNVTPVTHDRYNKTLKDPFDKPYDDEIKRMGFGLVGGNESFELITDGTYTITNYHLRYISQPVKVQFGSTYAVPSTDINCNLPVHTHREIVRIAFTDALRNIEAPRTQLEEQELNNIE